MRLTPLHLESTYSYLRVLPPFRGWKLPDADEIEFHVTRFGHFGDYGDRTIRVSERSIAYLITLLGTMAHEMVHLRLDMLGKDHTTHGPEFKRLWNLVARYHGFDPKAN